MRVGIMRPGLFGPRHVATVGLAGLMLSVRVYAQPWQALRDPRGAGWDPEALEAAWRLADSVGSTSVFVVHRGMVVAAWGEVTHPVALTSVRKSLMATLFGARLRTHTLDLSSTLGALGITDRQPLSDVEREATIRDVLAARTGVYRPAAQEPESWARQRPAAGAHRPGERWFYNNWSFNVAGTIYERWMGESVHAGFTGALARPLGMEDYRQDVAELRFREPTRSVHAAHAFRLSARDLARVGELYVRDGQWGGSALLVPHWRDSVWAVRTSSTDVREGWRSPAEGCGYGWLWWLNPGKGKDWGNTPALAALEHAAAIGAGGQLLVVAPREELVIVHLADRDAGRELPEDVAMVVVDRVAAAWSARGPRRSVRGAPVTPRPFTGRSTLPPPFVGRPPPADVIDPLLGGYDAGRGVIVRVFRDGDGLFVSHPRLGDNELLLDGESPTSFRSVGGRLRVTFAPDTLPGAMVMTVDTPAGPLRARRVRPSSGGDAPVTHPRAAARR